MHHSKLRPPRNVLVLFMAVSVVSVSALVWLSWRLLEQDRALESQRIQERLERVADLIVTSLDLGLSEIENRLPVLFDPGDHALSIAFGPREAEGRAFAAEVDPRAKPGAPAAVAAPALRLAAPLLPVTIGDTCRTFLDTPSRQAICWS
ncbi:MAG: hypothetical protein ABSF88_04675 [Candidatus Aminicenantales bacterium]